MVIQTPPCCCLSCGKRMDAAAGVEELNVPIPGDVSLCLQCGAVMAFAEDLTVRGLSSQEVTDICTNLEFLQFLIRQVRQIRFMHA